MSHYSMIIDTEAARTKAFAWIRKAPLGWMLMLREDTRTEAQNRLMWPLLTDISRQATHAGMKFTPEDWKDLLMAQLRREMRLVPNLDGDGFVNLNKRTSSLSKKEFSDLIELIYKLGAEKGVQFNDARRDAA